MDTGRQSQEITELGLKLRAEKIRQAELQAENQAIRNALCEMEQSLVEHKNYIAELWKENIYQNVQYKRVLGEAERDMEAWRAQCLARQLYIQHTVTPQIRDVISQRQTYIHASETLTY